MLQSLSHHITEFCFWGPRGLQVPSGKLWPDWGRGGWTFWKVLLSPERNSDRVVIGFLVTSLTKALPPRLLSLDGRPAPGSVLLAPNIFHLRGASKRQAFSGPSPTFAPPDEPVWEVYRQVHQLWELMVSLQVDGCVYHR